MLYYWSIIIVFIISLDPLKAQDERYFRKMFSGDLVKEQITTRPHNINFQINRNSYRIDLNDDGIEEILEPQKRDGVDWIEIRNSSGNKIFEGKIFAIGAESHLYKIKLVNLSSKIKALILFMDEGKISGKRFESTARIFVLSFENNNLSKIHLSQGPHFFHEKEAQREQYWRRIYNVNIRDIDNDGVREICIQYNKIQRIMRYVANGEWDRI